MNLFIRISLFSLAIFAIRVSVAGQGKDSMEDTTLNYPIKKESPDSLKRAHNPTKASIYSMVLPGLGQVYNRKYWKVPVIYAGFGVFYYFIRFNDKEYQAWRAAYSHSLINTDSIEPPVNDYERLYGDQPQILLDQKKYYRRNRDLTYILTSIWYLLNIVDATVDAHMFTWDIDENLSLKLEPAVTNPVLGYRPSGGFRLTFQF